MYFLTSIYLLFWASPPEIWWSSSHSPSLCYSKVIDVLGFLDCLLTALFNIFSLGSLFGFVLQHNHKVIDLWTQYILDSLFLSFVFISELRHSIQNRQLHQSDYLPYPVSSYTLSRRFTLGSTLSDPVGCVEVFQAPLFPHSTKFTIADIGKRR